MRSRAPALLCASLLACAVTPGVAAASKDGAGIAPYAAEVDQSDLTALDGQGVDLKETGFDPEKAEQQRIALYLTPGQASALEAKGVAVTAAPIEKAAKKDPADG